MSNNLSEERSAGGDSQIVETEFEVRRGVSQLTLEPGFAQVHVSRIPSESLLQERLKILRLLADIGVSTKFPKLTPSGISLTIPEDRAEEVEDSLSYCGHHFSVRRGRSVLSVHASNIREEDGLIGRIIGNAISSGVQIDHIGDMHDQTTMVVESSSVDPLLKNFQPLVNTPCSRDEFPAQLKGHRIKVMKFGGTSVATPEARMIAAMKVVSAKEMGFSPVVVVSAIGRKGLPYATDTLMSLLEDIDPNVAPDARELDLMISCGEVLSAVIFAQTLKTLGHNAQAFRGGQAGIQTDGEYGKARIVGIRPWRLERSLKAGNIPVVCGFQGVAGRGTGEVAGEVTTLGRGGSDTTASAIGAALGAEAVEIFTDVDGLKTADPMIVEDAQTLSQVSYDEVAALAHLGAKVVHPRSAEIAMSYGIPLWIKNTFSSHEGTEIVRSNMAPERRITGVTRTGRLVYLQFDLNKASVEDRRMLEGRIYETMAENGINLFMINISPSSTGFAVPRSSFPFVEHLCDGLVLPSLSTETRKAYLLQIGTEPSPQVKNQTRLLEPLATVHGIPAEVTQGCSMVSLVGREYIERPGVLVAILSVLTAAGVPVLQTSDGNYSLSLLVPESETNRTVQLLFDYFDLGSPE